MKRIWNIEAKNFRIQFGYKEDINVGYMANTTKVKHPYIIITKCKSFAGVSANTLRKRGLLQLWDSAKHQEYIWIKDGLDYTNFRNL
jgi:hypothetical protein